MIRNHKISPISAFSFFLFFATLFLSSQAEGANIPPGEQPGAQASRFQNQVENQQKILEKKKLKKPEIEIEKEKEKAPEAAAAPSFLLGGIKITGATVFNEADLAPCYKQYISKNVTLADLQSIAEKIKEKYSKKGYLTTVVYVPEQEIKEGIAEIKVLEGRLGEIRVEGNKYFPTSLIERYIHLKKNEVLDLFPLQRDMLRLNQNPDLEVKTVISPGKTAGYADIILKVKDKFPYHIGTSVDNQGTRLIGKYRDSFSFRSSNLTGLLNDSLFVTNIMTATSRGTSASYAIPIDTYGTKFGLDFTDYTSELGQEIKFLDIMGRSVIWTPHIMGEIYLSEDLQANIDTGIDIKSIKRYTLGEISTNDQLRIPYVGYDVSRLDTFFGGGQTTFSPKLSFGTTHFLGASSYGRDNASRSGTGGFYFKYEQVLRRLQRMPFESYISARSRFQAASNTLPSSEQMQFGGANTIRGYPEGDYISDFGADLSTEWIFPMYPIPREYKLPYADTPLRQQIQPFVFMDMGAGKIKKVEFGERKLKLLMGLGGGVKFQFNRNLFLRIEWAERVGDRPSPGQGPSNFDMSFQFEL